LDDILIANEVVDEAMKHKKYLIMFKIPFDHLIGFYLDYFETADSPSFSKEINIDVSPIKIH
jgi:predicted homoserine dehydrogenase-like protein